MNGAEIGKVLREFFYNVRGAQLTHIMTGDFFVASGRCMSTSLIELDFTADTLEEAALGLLALWKETKNNG